MSLQLAISNILPVVPVLDESNWFTFTKQLRMFFIGCGRPEVVDGSPPTEGAAKAAYDKDDSMLLAFLFTKVSPSYQFLILDESTASGAYGKLKGHFQKSTVGHRMAARKEFYDVAHDPDQPISLYVQAVKAAATRLTAFGVDVPDTELVDVLLMGLHESWNGIRSSILMAKSDPKSTEVIDSLTGSAAATEIVSVKVEEGPSHVLASRAQHFGRGRRHGPYQEPSGSDSVDPQLNGRIDEHGNRWCDTTRLNGCHRCGRSGHHAARCMVSMPRHIKEWIMTSTSRSPSPAPRQSARTAHTHPASHTYDDDDDYDDIDVVAQQVYDAALRRDSGRLLI